MTHLKHINYFQIFNKKDLFFFQNSIFIYVCTLRKVVESNVFHVPKLVVVALFKK